MAVACADTELAGKYRLRRLIGQGGMGEVWVARHLELGVDVAVKVLSPALSTDADAPARFRREARAAARLKSPHVVTVHDFGQDGATPYLVMELLEGETLDQRVQREGPLEPKEAGRIVAEVCSALALAHAAGIVHRDIKPSNLFLAQSEGHVVLKVLDFGIARVADADGISTTQSGVIVGSPVFMSPEQANGDVTGFASDLWSLAAVAYWLLTAEEPFKSPTVLETLARIRAGSFSPPSTIAQNLPRTIDAFFRKAFQIAPARRFASARAFQAAFSAAVAGEVAERAPAQERAVRPLARHHTTRAVGVAPVKRRWRSALVLLGSVVALAAASLLTTPRGSRGPQLDARRQASTGGATTTIPRIPSAAPPLATGSAEPRATGTPKTSLRSRGRPRPPQAPVASAPVPAALTETARPAIPLATAGETDPLFGLPEDGAPDRQAPLAPRASAASPRE